MLERQLDIGEKEQVLAALNASAIAPSALCSRAVRDCVLIRRTPMLTEVRGLASSVAYAALKTRASAITLGKKVYIRREFFSDEGEIPLDLIAHEIAHVVQFERDGFIPFLFRYMRDYARGLARGLGDRQAYLAIPYEVEARRVSELMLKD